MRKTIISVRITLILILITLLSSNAIGSIVSNVTWPNSGTISYSRLIGNSNYDYTMVANSTAYYIIAKNGSFAYSNANPKTAFTQLGSYVNNGGSAYINCSITTTLSYRSITLDNINDAIFAFDPTSMITMGYGVGNTGVLTAALFVTNCNNVTFVKPNINGNAVTQGGTGSHSDGILIVDSNNVVVDGAYITGARMFGFVIISNSAGYGANGIINSLITYSGWNGIQLGTGGPDNFTTGAYAINNEVSHASDVGISTYDYNSQIIGNYVHDIDGSTGGGFNAHWGIAVEAGKYNMMANNTVTNCAVGITISPDRVNPTNTFPQSNTIRNNTIANCSTGITSGGASSSEKAGNNVITQNRISNWGTGYSGIAIAIWYGINETISYNTVTDNRADAGYAITVRVSDDCKVQNNSVNTPKTSAYSLGVALDVATNTVVEHNTIQAALGINIASTVYYTIVTGNTIDAVIPIADHGVGTIINP